eukprot:m.25500 g.25500  ORF g.25500 m.25500 type:complete len:631 (+) comp7709_c0_seq1:150-2042(+)
MPVKQDVARCVGVVTQQNPLDSVSPYHAFSSAPATEEFAVPTQWPGPPADDTTARVLCTEESLFVCFECEGDAIEPIQASEISDGVKVDVSGEKMDLKDWSVLVDERVEVFIWPQDDSGTPVLDQRYFAYEINFNGVALTNHAQFGGRFDFTWGKDSYKAKCFRMAVGRAGAGTISASASAEAEKAVVVVEIPFKGLGLTLSTAKNMKIALHRAQHSPACKKTLSSKRASKTPLSQADVDAILSEMIWSSWINPVENPEEINFHRPGFFATFQCEPESENSHCCNAARLLRANKLEIVSSPKPLLSKCPKGAVLVKAKYASVCGSDMPYFKNTTLPKASSYWNRDGFCGHEVVGEVVASSSDNFAVGDPVLALPSSYFKAHAASRQEWYKESVHGVLLRPFEVRGGFSEIFTSHELYCYKLKELKPEMLIAQGLGTVLQLARKLGCVIGKTIAIVGQGQNGLLATRLLSQFAAKVVVGVDPLEYRQQRALECGATHAVGPDKALELIHELTDGRGVDIVIEMVGHNQDTINTCFEYVRNNGTVGIFGVPDDATYNNFEYGKMFRKNLTLVSAVVPDPGRDFPQALALIEQGRFATDGILTHSFKLNDIQNGFDVSSSYKDNVIKLVFEFD